MEWMSAALEQSPPHKLWTRNDCAALEKAGLIESDRYELIEGELVLKMSKNHPHVLAVYVLACWLRSVFGEAFVVQEPAIDLRPEDNPSSQPEPDVIVLNEPFRDLLSHARPSQLRLVAEVSSTTSTFDLTTKARLYARSSIPEYWVLDLERRRLIVHREPRGDAYQFVRAFGEDERVSPLAAPDRELLVRDLL
jgi:Uma2 family endonuclease